MKDPIVFLHGLGSTKHVFDEIRTCLCDEIIEALDLPGHGETKMLKNMSIDSLCCWLNDKILEPSIIAGHSLGAIISLAFAERYPLTISKIIKDAI